MTDEQPTPKPQPSQHREEGVAEPKSLSYVSIPALLTAIILSMVLLSGALYFWWVLGPNVRAQVSTLQLATLVLFLIVMLAMMLGIGYSHLWAADGQVVVRNGPFIKHYPIDQIAGLRLRKGDVEVRVYPQLAGEVRAINGHLGLHE